MREAPIRPMRSLAPVAAALLLVACDQPPVKEIAAAETALAQARKDDAERYAPDRLKEAEAAFAEAQRKVREKDYRGALSSATDAAEKGHNASQAAAAAKTVAKSAAEVAQTEVQAVLDEVAAIRDEATAAKIPDKAFEELVPLVDQVQGALGAAKASLEAGDLLGAQKAAGDLKAQVAPLPDRFREAQAKWEAEHPKARAKKRK